MHVILQISAINLEQLRGEEARRSRLLMGECIRLLRDRVQDQVLGVSDQTLVAVANLAAIEVCRSVEVEFGSIILTRRWRPEA